MFVGSITFCRVLIHRSLTFALFLTPRLGKSYSMQRDPEIKMYLTTFILKANFSMKPAKKSLVSLAGKLYLNFGR